ncbi:MAG: Lsr2 family protein [Naasia sp.]|nr:Lsr2 family protein [Naasia sp.]
MAQKVIVETVDDLDGTVLTDGSGGTVSFSFQGRSYEIDLSEDNQERLAEALEPYIAKARPTGQRRPQAAPRNAPSGAANSGRLQDIREWARANGHEVSDRGRISKVIQEAYERAN